MDLLNLKMENNSVACPICGEHYPSERILAVHIDDSHGLTSVIGPNATIKKKQVKFAGSDSTDTHANLDALDLSFGSPLGKSRSVDDIRTPKKEDGAFGFEGFGLGTPGSVTKQDLSRSRDKDDKREEKENRSLRNLFGRSKEKVETTSGNFTPSKESSQVAFFKTKLPLNTIIFVLFYLLFYADC